MTEPSHPEPPKLPPPHRARKPHNEAHASRRLFAVAIALIVLGGGGLLAWDWLSRGRGGESFVRPLPQATTRAAPEAPRPAPPEATSPPPVPAAPASPSPAPSASSEDLAARLTALEARLAQATATPAPPPEPAPPNPADAQIAQLQARVAALENAVSAERARADRAQAEARASAARLQTMVRAADALARLRTSLERGFPFEREYDDATAALSRDGAAVARLAPLRQWAESGIPTRAALREALETQGADIVRASILDGADTWWQAIVSRLRALIVVRPSAEGDIAAAGTPEGDRAPAIIARAEARLRDGDVAAAVAELAALSGAAADTAQAWVAAARARISADETMAALDESLRSSVASAPTESERQERPAAPPSDAPAGSLPSDGAL